MINSIHRFPALARFLSALLYLLFVPAPGLGATVAPEETARDFTIFLGLDLTYGYRGVDCPIVRVEKGKLVILHNGNPVEMPLEDGNYRTKFTPRISRTRLEVADIRTARLDSREIEQTRDAIAQGFLMESVRAQTQESSQIKERNTAQAVENARALVAAGVPVDLGPIEAQHSTALQATPQFRSALQGGNLSAAEDTGSGGPFDSYEVVFRIPTSIDAAFGVLRVLVRDPANPRLPTTVIRFFEVDRTGPNARPTSVKLKNLPQGFSVEGYAVHIFADGGEIPTNLSSNRVEVNADEAHQFMVLAYVQEKAGQSLPVAIVPELLPDELPPLLASQSGDATVDVSVDRDGRVTTIAPAPGSIATLTPDLAAALRGVRFFPALLEGRASVGRGTFALSEFVR